MSNPDVWSGATYKPLADGEPPAIEQWDIICLHTMAGYLDGTDSFFRDQGWSGTESHFGVGGEYDKQGQDGAVYQWVPCDRKADANLDGNWHVLSIETSDGAKGNVPWTDAQIESIAQICAWACGRYNIPAVLIPDSKVGRRGIGYHRQGIDPYRVSGGEEWSSSYGKTCPNDTRVGQVQRVVDRVNAILGGGSGGGSPPTPGEPAPEFPFPAGHYLGVESTSSYCHSGYYEEDRPAIEMWQSRMQFRGWSISVDGRYGPQSEQVCIDFQHEKDLFVDGLVGIDTWNATWEEPIT